MEQRSLDIMARNAKDLSSKIFDETTSLPNFGGNLSKDIIVKSIEISASEFHNIDFINWKRCRSVIEHENNLVNHRLTWLFQSQAALLTAFGVYYGWMSNSGKDKAAAAANAGITALPSMSSTGGDESALFLSPLIIISVFSMIICFNIFWGLKNASIHSSRITKWYYTGNMFGKYNLEDQERYNKLNEMHPPLHFWREVEKEMYNNRIENSFLLRGEAMPIYFIALWIMLFIFGIMKVGFSAKWELMMDYLTSHLPAFATALGSVCIAIILLFTGILLERWRSYRKTLLNPPGKDRS